MLVIFGANGRTGSAVVKEALSRGLSIRAVVRDDRDVDQLPKSLDLADLSYADPTSLGATKAVLNGATQVISCIDPRTSGPGAVIYPGECAEHIVQAAAEAGAKAILHVSVMGAYRWAYTSLNRKAFYLEGGVRNCDAPWAILRVSCYHDEVIEGHIRPPDGGRPSPFKASSRYSPVAREDAAKMILDYMKVFLPGRAPCIGGPEVMTGPEIGALTGRWLVEGGRKKTSYAGLPPGDVSVAATTTRRTIGWIPGTTLIDALEGRQAQPPQTDTAAVYAKLDPGPHPADQGKATAALNPLKTTLRRVVHQQLIEDLERLGYSGSETTLDWRYARRGKRTQAAHDGEMATYTGLRVLDAQGEVLHKGRVNFLRDELAETFFCWWDEGEIPQRVWDQLDMGVRRRLRKDKAFQGDARVEASRKGEPEKV